MNPPAASPQAVWVEDQGIRIPSLVLEVPAAQAVVLHAHASGSARSRDDTIGFVRRLARFGFTEILADLLTEGESCVRSWNTDVALLSERLRRVMRWLESRPDLSALPVALVGYGAAGPAALRVAAELPSRVAAVVLWDSQPDLAWDALRTLRNPVLLISPSEPEQTLRSNRWSAPLLKNARLEIVAGSSSLLGTEAWAFELASREAQRWLRRVLHEAEGSRSGVSAA